MKPFDFQLQPVLRHREILEDKSRQDFAEALGRERQLQEQVEARRSELLALQEELRTRQSHGIAVQDLLLFEESIAHVGRRLSVLMREAEEARHEIDRRREALAEASRDRRLLEKLKEKKKEEHGREMARQETILLDEIALQLDRERP